MAKDKNSVNKSQAIRDMLQQHPNAKAKEIVSLLAEQSINVTPGSVYVVKGKMAQMKHHKARKAKRLTRATSSTGSSDPIDLIVKVKALAKEAGGFGNLQQLIAVLAD